MICTMHQVSFRPAVDTAEPLQILLPEDATVVTAAALGELHIQLWYYAFTRVGGEFAEVRAPFDVFTLREYDKVALVWRGREMVWLAHVQLKAMHFHVFVPGILRRP